MREDSALRRRFSRPTLVVAWVVAVGVLAFVLTSGAAGATARHGNGSAKSAHSTGGGDSRFAADRDAAEAQYGPHRLHRHRGPISQEQREFVSSTAPTTEAGLPFTGENVLEVVALGLLLTGGGLVIARRVRRRT